LETQTKYCGFVGLNTQEMKSGNTKKILEVLGIIIVTAVLLALFGFLIHAFAFFYGGRLLGMLGFVIYLIVKLEHNPPN
jgi:uncharacterized membrane protein YkgB